jgi:hypothetical protein
MMQSPFEKMDMTTEAGAVAPVEPNDVENALKKLQAEVTDGLP